MDQNFKMDSCDAQDLLCYCTRYCTALLSLKYCTDYVYLIDLVSVNNFNISRHITPRDILIKCYFLEAVMIIRFNIQPPANPLFQFSNIIDAVLTYLKTEFINYPYFFFRSTQF